MTKLQMLRPLGLRDVNGAIQQRLRSLLSDFRFTRLADILPDEPPTAELARPSLVA